jgi:hypothetical protein
MLGNSQQAAHQPAEIFPCHLCVFTPAQKVSPLMKNPQQNGCLDTVQPLVTDQPENGNPQRNQPVNIINYPAFKLSKPNPPAASNMLFFCEKQ